MSLKILIIDPDVVLCEELKRHFERDNYKVKTSQDGIEGHANFKLFDPDLVICEMTLPRKNGLELCRIIRENSDKPLIMTSSNKEMFDIILALELGADDHVCKPFDTREMAARIKAQYRRYTMKSAKYGGDTIKYDNIEISYNGYNIKLSGQNLTLPPKEFELLYFLAANYNRAFSRDQLLDKVWGFDYLGDSRTVDVHIKRIREKICGISEKWELKTIWGHGYKFEVYE